MVKFSGARIVTSRFALRCVHGVSLTKRCQRCATAEHENVVPLPSFTSRMETKA